MKTMTKYLLGILIIFAFLTTIVTKNAEAETLSIDNCPTSPTFKPSKDNIPENSEVTITYNQLPKKLLGNSVDFRIRVDNQYVGILDNNYSLNLGKYNKGEHYVELIVNEKSGGTFNCGRVSFYVGESSPPKPQCPSFSSTDPPFGEITEKDNIKIYYKPLNNVSPSDYVGFVDKPGNNYELDASWSVDIGPWSAGSHFFQLRYIASSGELDCPKINLTVKEKLGQPWEAGKNPCVDGKCNTALGLISSDPTEFVGSILSIALGLAGGIALIIMVIGSVGILTSSGDQNKLNANRDKIIAAIAGLLFLIFSVLILRFLGIVFEIPFT